MKNRSASLREEIEELIATGQLQPGHHLDETELAERFGVSRTPIREALIQLASMGIIEMRPRRGAQVATISPQQLVEMFEVMAEFEAMCGRMAARANGLRNSLSKQTNSFGAAQRIPRTETYNNCLKSLVISDSYFKIFFVPNQFEIARLGIVAAKRLMPKAVDRNRTKRGIRELFRMHQISHVGIDIVVMARKPEPLGVSENVDGLSKLFSRVVRRCTES